MNTILPFILSLFITVPAFAASPMFLGLSGQVKCDNQDRLMADIETTLIAPLDKASRHIKTVYNYLTDGDCQIFLGLVIEDKDAEGQKAMAEYIDRLQKSGFYGLAIQFNRVVKMEESVMISSGLHIPGTGDMNVLDQRETSLPLASLADWESFTDTVGRAFQSHTSTDFQTELSKLLGQTEYPKYASEVLTKSDMVSSELEPKLILENGSIIDEDSGISPFFDMPFSRNCWAADYEGGMCL